MTYLVGEEIFPTKEALKQRCRAILEATVDGDSVIDESQLFLMALFQNHDEWSQKAKGGVRDITTQRTSQGTRCFVLRKHDRSEIDISFPHAIRLMPSTRSANLMPQALRDFRNAARNAIQGQIFTFRDQNLPSCPSCPLTGEPLSRLNVAVDHIPPATFDQLLFDFCVQHALNPLIIIVGSESGTVAILEDQNLLFAWQDYHADNAKLRLLSKLGNLQLPKAMVSWDRLFW
ncbi:DUF3223 domain-containing protein [Ferribacterium limneticum]|uniref:DUF3223 domain-containing protein n=1 Tax=Ferribacterium limneticum TaxID=76259 RepID=UPI001CF96D94|nr:DUF3223 domain-containing protein [Ferribacterium limneticum]UCV27551.1 DUF3223 domain-containing protein [Ferribacterium limneticum]UCV31468.1 DUF3223 domain-containing protein [Ferribacterium limneticum]